MQKYKSLELYNNHNVVNAYEIVIPVGAMYRNLFDFVVSMSIGSNVSWVVFLTCAIVIALQFRGVRIDDTVSLRDLE